MPTSHPYQINEITELIVLANPSSVLDIGVGFGKYGFLCREYLEFYDGREQYSDWKTRIDGIEAFEEYITPVHKFIYNNIYIGNAMELLPKMDFKYDLIIMIDVLEHLTYEDGMKLLGHLQRLGKNIIISTPKDIGVQENSFGNEFETHRFQWKYKHFASFPHKLQVINDASLIVFMGEAVSKMSYLKRLKLKLKKDLAPLRYPMRLFGA